MLQLASKDKAKEHDSAAIEQMILEDCQLLGINLPAINSFTIPRFSLPLSKINYAALISKALYIAKSEQKAKQRLQKGKTVMARKHNNASSLSIESADGIRKIVTQIDASSGESDPSKVRSGALNNMVIDENQTLGEESDDGMFFSTIEGGDAMA